MRDQVYGVALHEIGEAVVLVLRIFFNIVVTLDRLFDEATEAQARWIVLIGFNSTHCPLASSPTHLENDAAAGLMCLLSTASVRQGIAVRAATRVASNNRLMLIQNLCQT